MGLLALLVPLLSKVIENLFPDPTQQANAKLQVQEALNQAAAQAEEADAKQVQAKAGVVQAEIQGASYMQRNWRPTLMYLFMFIIANNYIVFPILHAVFPSIVMLQAPEQMWTLINICVGGYVGGRSLEKIAHTVFSNDKFFTALKQRMGKLTQAQVDAINASLDIAEKSEGEE